jgi:hypothetical protein
MQHAEAIRRIQHAWRHTFRSLLHLVKHTYAAFREKRMFGTRLLHAAAHKAATQLVRRLCFLHKKIPFTEDGVAALLLVSLFASYDQVEHPKLQSTVNAAKAIALRLRVPIMGLTMLPQLYAQYMDAYRAWHERTELVSRIRGQEWNTSCTLERRYGHVIKMLSPTRKRTKKEDPEIISEEQLEHELTVLAFEPCDRRMLVDPATGCGFHENAQFRFVPFQLLSQVPYEPPPQGPPMALWQALQELKWYALATHMGTEAAWSQLVKPETFADEWLTPGASIRQEERLEAILQLLLAAPRLTETQVQRMNMQWSNDVILNTETWNNPAAFVVKGLQCLYHMIAVLQVELVNQRVETLVLPLYKMREAPPPSTTMISTRMLMDGVRLSHMRLTRMNRWLERTLFTPQAPATLLSLTIICHLIHGKKRVRPEVFALDEHRIAYMRTQMQALLDVLQPKKRQSFVLRLQHSVVTNKPFHAPREMWKDNEPRTEQANALAKQVTKMYHAHKQLYGATVYLPLFRKAQDNGGSFRPKKKIKT